MKTRTYQRSDGDPVGGLGDWPRRSWPLWARWNDELDQRYTLGVEEEGRDSGFASARTLIFQAFPRTALPRAFADYADYVEAVDALIAPGAIPDPSFLWWTCGCSRRSGRSRCA
ncbi:MAG: glutamate-cysteine ligase family protein [Solirubrobacteraceae bacterium]